MAFFIKQLTNYMITGLGGSWVFGTDVFINGIPEDAKPALALYEEPGETANPIAGIYTPYFRLLSRAKTAEDAMTNWWAAFTVLNRVAGVNLTNFQIVIIQSLGSSPRIEREESGDIVLEGNFRVRYKDIEL